MIILMVFQNVPSLDQDYNTEIIVEDMDLNNFEFHETDFDESISDEISQEEIKEKITNVVEEEVKPEIIPVYNKKDLNFGTIYTATTGSSVIPRLNFSSNLNMTSVTTQDVNARTALNLTLNLTARGNIDLAEVPIDYVLVLDWSGSVGRNGWRQTVDWAIGFVNSLKVADRISIIRFSTEATNLHSLVDNQHRPTIINILRGIPDPSGYTSTKDAVNATLKEFRDHSDIATPKFMFMVTDGVPYGAPIPGTTDREDQDPCPLAQNLRDNEIATLLIGVGNGWNQQVIECLVENPVTDLIRIQDYNSLSFDPEDISSILGNLANTTAFNINLTIVFDGDVNLLQFSNTPSTIIGDRVTWSIDKMKDNETMLISVILDVSGEGTVPIYTIESNLEYQPVNESSLIEILDALNVEITVEDTDPPIVAVPPDLTVEAQSSSGTVVFFAAVAYDLKDGNLIPDCNPVSGTLFPIGDTMITCSATDNSGNFASASFVITVIDSIPPTLVLPTDIYVEADGPTGTIVEYSSMAYDQVDGQIDPFCTPSSGSTFELGTTYVSCIAEDSSGNTESGTFAITVVDTQIPTLSNPDDIIILEGISDDNVMWVVSDDFPDYFELFQDGTLIYTNTWVSGDNIGPDLTGLGNGTYIYELVVYDTSGNFAVDEVQVTVISIYSQFDKVRELIIELGLKSSKTNVLLGKLDLAIIDFEDGKYRMAVKHLNTLMVNLKAFTKCKAHLQEAVDLLIQEIQVLIQQINLFKLLTGSDDSCHCHCKN